MTHEQIQATIPKHFRGAVAPVEEQALRAHLPDCAACRDKYNRRLLWMSLTGGQPMASQRIARGLGVAAEPAPRRRAVGLLVTATALAAALLLVRGPWLHHRSSDGEFQARGGVGVSGAALWVYQLGADGRPHLAVNHISRGDELAFAYGNPSGKKNLTIFGVDEHRHVYWFHPAWSGGSPPTGSIPARQGPGPHELPEAIRQSLDGSRLELYAVFADASPEISAVESAVAHGTESLSAALPSGAEVARRALEVTP